MSVSFSVRGRPITQGSKIAAVNRHTGHAVMREVNGTSLQAWRLAIAAAARDAMGDRPLMTGALRLRVVFRLPRPQRPKCDWPIGPRSGDVDKYLRACGDAMSQVVYADDAQLVDIRATKAYAAPHHPPGVSVSIEEIR